MFPITSILACSLGVLLIVLSWLVIQLRRMIGASIGDEGDTTLSRRIRAQANLTEYAPLFVILIGLAEAQAGPSVLLGATAGLFFLARLAHGYAMALTLASPVLRYFGVAATFISMIGAIFLCFESTING
ncbi:MAPEG family protein [Aliiroseovarius sp. 2305UL8-7]|uniref:MAPEG family protein n=1 Tax=Aliiroseovarius conchicola TaxID=3121637 RepID=UPI0035285783